MSKKTKRLEKENLTLTRKHDQTNRNILEMAEERTRDKEDLERLRKQEQQMRNIIKSMQEQGRGVPAADVDDGEGTESEYDEEYEDEDEEEDDEDYEEHILDPETIREETENIMKQGPPVFGPVPPPNLDKGKGVAHPPRQVVNGVAH